jgi:hypothetical protein
MVYALPVVSEHHFNVSFFTTTAAATIARGELAPQGDASGAEREYPFFPIVFLCPRGNKVITSSNPPSIFSQLPDRLKFPRGFGSVQAVPVLFRYLLLLEQDPKAEERTAQLEVEG